MQAQNNVHNNNIPSFALKGWEKEHLNTMTSLADCVYGRSYGKQTMWIASGKRDCILVIKCGGKLHGMLFGNIWVLDFFGICDL